MFIVYSYRSLSSFSDTRKHNATKCGANDIMTQNATISLDKKIRRKITYCMYLIVRKIRT